MQVLSTTVIDAIAMFSTDRGFTGQGGVSVARGDESGDGYPAALAAEIFGADDAAAHVFVASNQVVVRRDQAWDPAGTDLIAGVITRFFVFYDEA
ncbi:MAG: hypothetical protein MUP76_09360 [Acidimicrobiia bacterium]|nr:hypothetical protein [Acidimicrobiia bacterium]